MNVDVFWVAPDEDWITRGYADCAFLEALLRNELWRPQHPFTFTNHDVRGDLPHHDGGVVCFSGMGLAPYSEWIIEEIDKMAWSLVIICGNECWDFPWEQIPETETRRVWVMNPTPEHAHLSNRLPGGWYTGTREGLREHSGLARDRPLDWFLGAQVINDRRRDALRAMQPIPKGATISTERFMSGVPYDEWLTKTISAKAIPCPSGPMTLDANRPLAALEAGCVPILDLRKPLDPQFDYWELVFGPGYPMPVVFDWITEAQAAMDGALKAWPRQSNRMFAWWQQWKRWTAHHLHNDIAAVSNADWPSIPDDRITAVITTSPIPSHPDTLIIEQTVQSIREQLPLAEIIIAFDGVRPEQEHMRADYDEYVRRVLWKCNWEWENVLPVVMPEWGHQANTTRFALDSVETDTFLFVEHDTPILGDIPWHELIEQIEMSTANVIRLHQDVDIHPDHQKLMLDPKPTLLGGIPLRRTAAWWQRPHLANVDFYKDMLNRYFPTGSRTMIEDRVYSPMWIDCVDKRRAGWANWRVWIYQPEGDMRRSGHTDGRGEEPKYDMLFAPKAVKDEDRTDSTK